MTGPLTIVPRPIGQPPAQNRPTDQRQPAAGSFETLLNRQLQTGELRFSKHASERLQQRGLDLTTDQNQRLDQAVTQLRSKGGNDALVLLDNLAMVVSVKNQTVVTVVDQNQLQEKVFTQIDSAAIA